jgi:rod shape-determining protein MreD
VSSERFPGIRPRQSLGRQLDMSARRFLPATATAVMLLLTATPMGLAGQPELQAASGTACVFFWSLFRPASMPPPAVFMLGLLTDLLGFSPPGVGVLTMLIVHGLALRWRRGLVRQGFMVVWLVFAAVSVGAAAMTWTLTSLLTFRLFPPGSAFFQAALGAGLYPPLAVILTWAHQTLAEPERA